MKWILHHGNLEINFIDNKDQEIMDMMEKIANKDCHDTHLGYDPYRANDLIRYLGEGYDFETYLRGDDDLDIRTFITSMSSIFSFLPIPPNDRLIVFREDNDIYIVPESYKRLENDYGYKICTILD